MPTNAAGTFLRGLSIMLLKLYDNSVQGADVVISPQIGEINMFEGNQREQLMHAGEEAAKQALPAIKKLLRENKIKF